ncbi:MAG: DUF4442 domain-containing protein [Yaniella sp.]|nr:DUF4442 domain-containing protein [Yaniella sp.]
MRLPKLKIHTAASMNIGPKFLQRFMRIWPPYLGAGIKTQYIADNASRAIVTHKPNLLTRNLVGTAFGGTMLSMTDPFFMFAGVHGLGKEYLVWDVGVEAQFIKPGKGKITADFQVSEETWDLIREKTMDGEKYLHWFEVAITDESGDTVAIVRRQVYFRKKRTALTEKANAK